jgi:hypothetical protein
MKAIRDDHMPCIELVAIDLGPQLLTHQRCQLLSMGLHGTRISTFDHDAHHRLGARVAEQDPALLAEAGLGRSDGVLDTGARHNVDAPL